MKKTLLSCCAAVALCAGAATPQAEFLDRGVVAVKTTDGVFVSWRSLNTDPETATFDIYRDGVKINTAPISAVTNFTDPDGVAGATYEVKASAGTQVSATGSCKAWDTPYLKVHLDRPAGGKVGANGQSQHSYVYTPDDVSVGDVDGDGVYELFVKWMPSDAKDSASKGLTGPTIIDCYKLDGTRLWRIDLGHNIRSGNHYTQFMVYDFDGDGSAEMICKTAPGTKDGKGNWVLMPGDKETDDYRQHVDNPSKSLGHVLGGSEYLTCFSGKTGEALSTIAYKPGYNHVGTSVWGDNYGNRSDRYLAGVAYLDGQHPSAVFARGYYRCAFVWAVDFDGQNLTERWFHESKTKGQGLWGEGAHSLTIGDVDGDGCDEITYGAAALDQDGTLLYRTNPNSDNTEGHGDALHLAKMLPDRAGLQVFMPHEETEAHYPFNTEMRDARTGEIIFSRPQTGKDIGRGIAANVSPNYPGYEYWAASDASVYSYGEAIASNRPPINFRIYWDGDLLDELLDGSQISKPLPDFSKINVIEDFYQYSNASSCNGTKATPNLSADLFGDWREEVILHDGATNEDLLIFTTTIPTNCKLTCLMQDHNYRMAIAFQNTAYNQPPHLSYSPEEEFSTSASIVLERGSASQMVAAGSAIEPVVLSPRRAQGIVCPELPKGLEWKYDAATSTGTLSGKPAADGDYTITFYTTGAADGNEAPYQVKLKVNKVAGIIPLAYFSFDAVGATIENHVHGSASVTGNAAEAIDGVKGKAALLDGTNYYSQEAYPEIQLGSRDFTVEFWMKSADDAAYIFHKGSHAANDATGATGHWTGLELKNGVLYFCIDDNITKSQAYVKDAAKWFDNQWHHMVMVRDTYTHKLILYIDGVQVAEGADNTGAIADNNENLVLGNVNVNFDNFFSGALDEFTIYEGAMSADKVAERFATTGKELAYFPFDEVGATTPNLIFGEAEAREGTPAPVEGIKNGAAEFANGSHYAQAAYDAIQLAKNPFTVELWLKSEDTDGYLFFKGSHSANTATGATGCWIGLERHSNGSLNFAIDDNATKTDCRLADANRVFDGKWHHVACVRDIENGLLLLYVDGEEAARSTDKTGAIADNNETLLIGISDEVARPYDGVIDEFVIHPMAMSADDVRAAYNALAESSIKEIIATSPNALYTVVDAMSGRLVRQARGADAATITSGLATGVYVIVIEAEGKREVYKFVI